MKQSYKQRLIKSLTYSGLLITMIQPTLGVTEVVASPDNINTVGTEYTNEQIENEEVDIQTLLEDQDVNLMEIMELIRIKEEDVAVLLSKIEVKENELRKLEKDIIKKDREISRLEEEINETKEDLQKKMNEYNKNIERAAARTQTLQKEEKDKINLYLEAIFNSEGLTDIIGRLRSVNIIMSSHEKQIEEIEKQANEIEGIKNELEENEKQLKREKSDLEISKREVQSERDSLTEEKEGADKIIQELDEERAAIQEAYDGNLEALYSMQVTENGQRLYEEMIANEQERSTLEHNEVEGPAKDSLASLQSALNTIRSNRRDPEIVSSILEELQEYIGIPYVWGGATTNGFDCSGLVQFVYRNAGIDLPRVTQDQVNAGVPIAMADAQPGDLLFWEKNNDVYHVAVYIGGGEYIHAPRPGKSVTRESVRNFTPTYARRVIPNAKTEETKNNLNKDFKNLRKGEFIGEFEATAYAVGGWAVPGTVTANGTDIKNTIYSPEGYNIIAVDPRIIPMNSVVQVEVPGMEPFLAKASDTGGAIKGHIIDILFGSVLEANQFGRQNGIKIYKVK